MTDVTNKTLAEYELIDNLGGEALRVWSDSIKSKSLSMTDKSKILATLLQSNQWKVFDDLIPYIRLPEMVRTCKILDQRRAKRQIEDTTEGKVFSLTSTRVKHIKRWVRAQTKSDLEFFALTFPLSGWKELADFLHLNPEKDFPKDMAWFLPYAFNGRIPEGSVIEAAELLHTKFEEVYPKFHFPYSFIRTKVSRLSNRAKEMIVKREGVDTALWFYSELGCPEVDVILREMLETDELVDLSYGAMVKILADMDENSDLFKMLADKIERKLRTYDLKLPQPVVVFGDASASMQVAIKTSGIIASLLTSIAKSKLHLFRNVDEAIENPPRTVREAITFGRTMKACRSTSPAASLYPYLERKEEVKTFILVTDEIENVSCEGYWESSYSKGLAADKFFARLYQRYIQEVGVARLVIISFSDPNKDADMVVALKKVLGEETFCELVDVHKLNLKNPDLNRLDYILDRLAED